VSILTLVIVIAVVCKRRGQRQESFELQSISADVEKGQEAVIKIEDTKSSEETLTDKKEEGREEVEDPIYSEISKIKK
jgi:hypothetical protein